MYLAGQKPLLTSIFPPEQTQRFWKHLFCMKRVPTDPSKMVIGAWSQDKKGSLPSNNSSLSSQWNVLCYSNKSKVFFLEVICKVFVFFSVGIEPEKQPGIPQFRQEDFFHLFQKFWKCKQMSVFLLELQMETSKIEYLKGGWEGWKETKEKLQIWEAWKNPNRVSMWPNW